MEKMENYGYERSPPPPYDIDNQPLPPSAPWQPPSYSAQQSQQQVVVVDASPTSVTHVALVQSYVSHVMLACFTAWCCGIVFGLIAFILAVMAQEKSTSPDPSERTAAMQLGRASIRVSIAGIIVGSVVGVFLVVINTTFATS